jgi:hypothetical protein
MLRKVAKRAGLLSYTTRMIAINEALMLYKFRMSRDSMSNETSESHEWLRF